MKLAHNPSRAARFVVSLFLIALVLCVDLFSKAWMRTSGAGICNEGVSFGITWMSESATIAISAFLILAGLVYLVSLRVGRSIEMNGMWLGLVLMIAGGLSNVVSRVIWGCIVDWISLGIAGLYFNFADVMIDLGLVLFIAGTIVVMYKNRRKYGKKS